MWGSTHIQISQINSKLNPPSGQFLSMCIMCLMGCLIYLHSDGQTIIIITHVGLLGFIVLFGIFAPNITHS